MTVKHTPGPWKVFAPTSRSSNDMAYGIDSDKGTESTSVVLFYGGILKKEDAMLIAAAPDLLEALKALTHSLDVEDLLHDDQRSSFAAAIAAIAKATYKEP